MNFKELCETRYSVRHYLDKPIEKEKIEYILECAQLAPSAANYQPWMFYVVESGSVLNKLKSSYHRDWIDSAPMCIVVCKDTSLAWRRAEDGKEYGDVDAAIAGEHICLAAETVDLGACWVCNFSPDLVCEALDLPQNEVPIVIFAIGYIDKEKSKVPQKKRRSLDEIVKWI